MQEIFDAPEWFEALTLGERAALLAAGEDGDPASAAQAGRAAPTPAGGVDSPDLAGRARAAQKLARWRREAGLLSDDLFAERLAGQGLTPEELLCILAEPAGGLRRRAGGRPDWLQRLADCFSRPASPLPPGSAADGLELGLLELFRPLVAEARARLLGGLRSISSARPSPAVCDPEAIVVGLLGVLLDRLREAAERTLVLELHACRLEGRLSGETPEERFSSFVGLLRDRAAGLEILRRYPVLARDACRCADQWVEAGLEMMRRLAADRGEIAGCLAAGSDPGPAVAARAGLGDPHGGGRSVAVLTFASGLRIVYKPRSLAIEARFQQLIGELNRRGLAPPLRPLAVVDRGSHGWMEHVAAAPCRTADEVERFHERQGVWLALLYAFEATDCHWENLVAAGEHPVPIDLETLFQGIVEEPSDPGAGWVPSDHTVLRGGLLPRRFWAEGDHGGLDLSGMGAAAGQAVEIGRMVGAGTDRIRWAREREQIGAGPHLPTLRGEPVSLWQHREAVLRGFRSTWHLVRRHRGELEGWLAGCAELPVRALLRPTVAYAHLLHTARHPDYLRCALDRDRLHDRLWTTATAHPRLRRALRRESEDLAAGDVPRFLALAGSRDLLDPEGGRIAGFFARSGLELVRRRLGEMDGEELERQSWLVRAALEATRPLAEHRARGRETLPESGAAEPRSFLDAACRLGDRLSRLALERAGRVTWFHLEVGDDGWRLAPMPVNLYSGLLGAALFFAHLARFSPDGERHERLARLALGTARRRLAADRGEVRGLGAFSGWGGVVYGLTHLGLLWQEPALLDEAEGWAARMGPLIASDEVFDLIGGSAGAAAALLALGRHRPSAARLELAVACGEIGRASCRERV